MSVINSQPLIGASGNQGGAYNIERSLRFRSSATAFLSRTNSSSPTSATTWTYSTWVKRGSLNGTRPILNAYSSTTATSVIDFSSDTIRVLNIDPSGNQRGVVTNAVYRDPSAWYHIVVSSTASSTPKLYVNGVEVTSFSSSSAVTASWYFGSNSVAQWIGREQFGAGNDYFDGYLAEAHYIDGQSLTPSSFGETDAITGVWKPKRYTGTYGTNGFYLKFNDLTSTSTLGNDSSGNSNTWTVNNVSLTAGSTYDSMTDVPTLTSATAANYCVLNPLKTHLSPAISNGNLQSSSMSGGATVWGTMAVATGKWYFEATVTAAGSPSVGIIDANRGASEQIGSTASGSAAYLSDGRIRINSSTSGTYSSYTTNDVIGVAFDCDAPSVSFYKNNTLQATVTPTSGITYSPQFIDWNAGTSGFAANFGQRPFAYTPPSGFVALNTFNLPTSTIVAGNKQMEATLYTGTGSDLPVTVGFQPDLIWTKSRSAVDNHILVDAVRGIGNILTSNTANAASAYAAFDSFDSNGFTKNSLESVSGRTYVAWNWKANGAGSTNTAGSITSTVSANPSAGFSIVTYTGATGTTATVGHGLGVAPKFIIVKNRTNAYSWICWFSGVTSSSQFLYLNQTSGVETISGYWGGSPTSTTFPVNSTYASINESGSNFVAYCFTDIEGYSKFGTYTGNGSTDGPFVYTGFRPKFILMKRTNSGSADDWMMMDSSRSLTNVATARLFPNLSNAEATNAAFDFLSNGFKIRDTNGSSNASGGTYIYAAFAEVPTKFALAR